MINTVQSLKIFSLPRFEGGNLVVDLHEDEFKQGIENIKFSMARKHF